MAENCPRCNRPVAWLAYVEGRDVPLCLHCRLENLRDKLERSGCGPDLLASFPERQSRTATSPGGAQVPLKNLTLTNDAVRDLDAQNLEVLDWAIKLLRDAPETMPTGDRLSGLADSVVRAEIPSTEKNGMIEKLGVLALDRVAVKLLNVCPRRD